MFKIKNFVLKHLVYEFPAVFRFYGISYLRINMFTITQCQISHSFLMININPFFYYDPTNPKGSTQKNNIEFDQILFDQINIDYDKEYIEEMIYQKKSQIYHGFINIMSSNYDSGQESLIDLKINNAVFKNINKARMNDNDAGGIFNFMNYKNIQLINITVENCNSPNAIIQIMRGDIIVIKDSKLLQNTVSNKGGGIVHIKITNNIIIRNSKFIQNNSTEGGAIHGEFISYFKVQDSLFQENQAIQGNGGAINAIHVKLIYIKSTIFDSNTAVKSGGSLFIKSSQNFGCIGLSNITATNNKQISQYNAQYGGFAVLLESHTLIMNETTINGFQSEITGGGLYLSEIYNMTLSNVNISNSHSSQYAGAAFIHRIGQSAIGGGEQHNPTIIMVIRDCTSFFGGGLFIQNEDIDLDITKVQFKNNYAHIEGHDSIQNFQSLIVVNIKESNSNILNNKKNITFNRDPLDMSINLNNFRSGSKVTFEFYVFANQIDNVVMTSKHIIQDEYGDPLFGLYSKINELQQLEQQLTDPKTTDEEINKKIKYRDLSNFLTIQKVDDYDTSHYISLISELDMQSQYLAYASYFIKQNFNLNQEISYVFSLNRNQIIYYD